MANLRVKEICKEKGITQKALAELMGVAEVSLSRSIKGNPSLETLEKIANALEVDIIELFSARENVVYGFIRVNGITHTINSLNELELLINDLKNGITGNTK